MTNFRSGLSRNGRLIQRVRGLIMRFLRYCRSTGRRRRARLYAWRLWRGWNAALVAVPLALAFIEVLAEQTEMRLLLFPSLASIAYLLFTRPVGPHATWRGDRAKHRCRYRHPWHSHVPFRVPRGTRYCLHRDDRYAAPASRHRPGARGRAFTTYIRGSRVRVSCLDLSRHDRAVPTF